MDESAAILALVTSRPGYVVEIFGLSVYRIENGQFVVQREDESMRSFDQAPDALEEFLKLRQEFKVGFDFEVE